MTRPFVVLSVLLLLVVCAQTGRAYDQATGGNLRVAPGSSATSTAAGLLAEPFPSTSEASGEGNESGTGAATSGWRSSFPAARSRSGEMPTAAGAALGDRTLSVRERAWSVQAPRTLYQGKTAIWWARRAIQNRKNSNARGRTIRRLKAQLRGGVLPWYWLAVGSCESGLRWGYNGSSGFDGALQFHPRTWSANRLSGYPSVAYLASPFQQLVVAEIVLSRQGWGAWPHCSRKVGLR